MIAATNRPDLIDDALTRAGRIERKIEVGVPDEETRREILAIHTRNRPLADDVDIDQLAAETDGCVDVIWRRRAGKRRRQPFVSTSGRSPTVNRHLSRTSCSPSSTSRRH